MSKQHFEWAAEYVRTLPADSYTDDSATIIEAFVSMFRRFGPRFDEGRFRRACEPRAMKVERVRAAARAAKETCSR